MNPPPLFSVQLAAIKNIKLIKNKNHWNRTKNCSLNSENFCYVVSIKFERCKCHMLPTPYFACFYCISIPLEILSVGYLRVCTKWQPNKRSSVRACDSYEWIKKRALSVELENNFSNYSARRNYSRLKALLLWKDVFQIQF